MYVPSAREIAERFVKFAPQRESRFEEGVRKPGKDWEKETAAAESNYENGVKEAMKRKAFGKGVKRVGTQKQQEKTIRNLSRWSEGISGAEDDMAKAMENVVAVLQAVVLPERYPKGDPRNYKRVEAVGNALRKAKEDGRI